MPAFSLADAYLEPGFNDPLIVVRRAETVDVKGRSQVAISRLYGYGVVCAIGPNELMRPTDYDSSNKIISIVTPLTLRSDAFGFKPDIVFWQGDSYLVREVDDYSGYGPGWVNVTAVEMDFNGTPDGFVFGWGNEVGPIRGWGAGNWSEEFPAV
jgi:galactose-6-phosphate isomerase